MVTNDGHPFRPADWKRLKSIAEGNPDETKIGAFGVGFYSVFEVCDEPLIRSGREALAFYYKGNTLYTRMVPVLPGDSHFPGRPQGEFPSSFWSWCVSVFGRRAHACSLPWEVSSVM